MNIIEMAQKVNIFGLVRQLTPKELDIIDSDDVLRAAKLLVDNQVAQTLAELTIKRFFR